MTTTRLRALSRAEPALRHLELQIVRRLDGLLQGDYLGLVPAVGSEPGEGREYRVGDDPRRMDWNLTARTGVPHVRDTIADRELETWILVDRTASLDFGTADCEKRDLVLAAVAAVGLLTVRAGNRVGALVLGGAAGFRHPARPGRDALLALLERLRRMPRAGDAGMAIDDLGVGLERLGRLARRRGLVVVCSDFLAAPGWERSLRALTARQEVLAVEVVDPRELELPAVGLLTLVDTETGRQVEVQTSDARFRRAYREAAAAQRMQIARSIRAAGASHLQLRTDRDWLLDIVRHVARRRRERSARVVAR